MGVLHPLVFATEMLVGVLNQGLPGRQQVAVSRLDDSGQQVNKFLVRVVHEGQTKYERIRPLQCGHTDIP